MAKEKFDFVQPFKDIPKSLKGFPKNMIRIWKEPVTSSAEVEVRKKEIFPLLYLFVGTFLLMTILSAVISAAQDVLMIVGMIPGVGAVICGFLLFVLKKAKEKFTDIECNNCKKRIAYDDNVQIKVLSKRFVISKSDKTIEKDGVPYQSTIKASGKEYTQLEITCKCQECGTEKTFTHEFVTAECHKSAAKVPYVSSGAMLIQFEQDVRNECTEGFDGKEKGKTARGVDITYNRTPESLVIGYFGNEIQMR